MTRPRFAGKGFAAIAMALAFLCGSCKLPPDGITRIQFSFWGTVEQQAVEESIIREFEKENPDIKVQTLPIAFDRYPEKIQAMMIGGVAPDVIMVDIRQQAEWGARGVLLDLTSEVAAISHGDNLMPVPERAFDHDGHFYSFPVNCHGFVTYCNLDALAAAGIPFPVHGWTWKQIEEMAPKLSRKAGNPSAPTDYVLPMPPTTAVLMNFGTEFFDDTMHPTRVTVDSPQAADAIEFMRRLQANKWSTPQELTNDGGGPELFRDGRTALYFSGRWETPKLAGKTKFRWDVTSFPAGPTGSHMSTHGGTGLAVWRKSRHIEAAKRFVRFYAGPRGVELGINGGRYAPVYRELAYSTAFLSFRPPESIQRFSETMEIGGSTYPLYAPGATAVTQIIQSRMEQALSQPSIPATDILAGLRGDLERWLVKFKLLYGKPPR